MDLKLFLIRAKAASGIILDPEELEADKIEFQYVSGSIKPDRIMVFYKRTWIFSYDWIDGVDAPLHSRLRRWHMIWKDRNPNPWEVIEDHIGEEQ